MFEILAFLVGVGCVLVLVALVGHGLWVVGVALLRGVFRGRELPYVPPARSLETRDELDATCRQLERMLARRELSLEEYDRLRDRIDATYARFRVLAPPRGRQPAVETAAEIALRSVTTKPEFDQRPATVVPQGAVEQASAGSLAEEGIVFAEIVASPPAGPPRADAAYDSAAAPAPFCAVPVTTESHDVPAAESPFHAPSPFDFEDAPAVHPARPLAEILTSFMLEKNIRWGELISGMLIVGSAVGLVVSLREELQRTIPYFPALLFMLVTAAIHGAGAYTLRKWNLKATSRGVLTIGLLLVPLNFLAACLLGGQREVTDAWFLLAMGVGVVGFTVMTYFSCRHLLERHWWTAFVPIMASSIWQVVIHRTAEGASNWGLQALAAVPVIGFLAGNLGLHAGSSRRAQRSEQDYERTLLTLGLSFFALVTAFALLLMTAAELRPALSQLSIAVALVASVWVSAGLLVQRSCEEDAKEATKTFRIVGTSLVLFGGFVSVAALALAWPQPPLLVAAAVIGFLILSLAAERGSAPVLHVGGLLNLAVAAVVGSHWMAGDYAGPADGDPTPLSSLVRAHLDTLLTATTSFALTSVTLIAAVFAWLGGSSARRGSATSRPYFVGTAALLAVLSIVVAGVTGFVKGGVSDLHVATGILFFYALAAILAGVWAGGRYLLRAGEGLLLVAFLHGLVANTSLREQLPWPQLTQLTAWLAALLAHGVTCAAGALLVSLLGRRETAVGAGGERLRAVARDLATGGLVTSFLAVPVACYCYSYTNPVLALQLGTICGVWLVGVCLRRVRQEFEVFQALSFAALATATSALSLRWGWHAKGFDPQHLRLWLSVGAAACVGWTVLRLWLPTGTKYENLVRPQGMTVDRGVLVSLTLLVTFGAAVACIPGVRVELGYPALLRRGAFVGEWLRALGGSLWIPLLWIAVAQLAALLQRYTRSALDGLLLVGLAAAALAALPMDASGGTASALRWTLSAYGLLIAWVLWQRHRLATVWDGLRAAVHPATPDASTRRLNSSFTWSSLALTILPLLLLVTLAASQGIHRVPFGGPAKDSWLGRIPVEVNYGVPLALVVAALLSHAVQRRQSNYAWCGSLILMYLLGTGFFLMLTSGENLARARWLVQIMQWGTIGTSVYGMLWLWLHPRIRADQQLQPAEDWHLGSHVAVPGVMTLLLSGSALFSVALRPLAGNPVNTAIGMPLGYVSLAATLILYGWFLRGRCLEFLPTLVAGFSAAGLGLIVGSTCSGETGVTWIPFRVLMLGSVGVATLACLVPSVISRWWTRDERSSPGMQLQFGVWTAVAGAAAFLLSWRAAFDDPDGATWALGTVAALLALVTSLALWLNPSLAYLGAGLIVTGGIYVSELPRPSGTTLMIVHGVLVAMALYAMGWLSVDLYRARRRSTLLPAFQHVAKTSLLVILMGMVGLEFVVQCFAGVGFLPGQGELIETPTGWAALLMGGLLLVMSLWDSTSRRRILQLHIWGLGGVLLACVPALDGHYLLTVGSLAVAGYLAVCGWLWRNQVGIVRIATSLRISDAVDVIHWTGSRFVLRQVIFVLGVTAVQLLPLVGFEERPLRFAAALVPLLGALAIAATSTVTQYRFLPTLALLLFAMFGVYSGWADLPAGDSSALWLLRTVRLLIVVGFLTFFFGGVIPRYLAISGAWIDAFKRTTTLLAGATVVSLIAVLCIEGATYQPDVGVPLMTTNVSGAVAMVLVAMIAGLIAAAVLPERDPLALSLTGRMGYVYLAQLVAGLIFLHVWMTMPWLFHHRLRPFWPYIVMVISFVGVGLAELFKRRNLTVLSEPFSHTGLLLPLVLAGLMWFIGHNSEPSAVLLAVGMLYLAVGVLRGSLVLGASAILFGNLALWAFYGKFDEWSFVDRPQFWLIPPALCVLVAGQLNRSRLSENQLAVLRYLCVAVIYVSSTSEIFITGVGESLWPPVILAVLAVLGVFGGMVLQIRAFLFLGSSFLFVSVLSMVMHAHRAFHHVWPWWAFGVGMGVAILVMFGLFEKKRPELTAWVERIRHWEK